MLQRPLQRWPRRLWSVRSSNSESCACLCSAAFNATNTTISNAYTHKKQNRRMATMRKSPATKDRSYQQQNRGRNDDDRALPWVKRYLAVFHNSGTFHTPPDTLLKFVQQINELFQASRGTTTADPIRVRELMVKHGIDDKEALELCNMYLREGSAGYKARGKKLMLTLSRGGLEEATLKIMTDIARIARRRPHVLRSREIVFARGHLTQLANAKVDYRAMTLEGRLAKAVGEEERAIELWTDAMDAAVAASEARSIEERDPLQLSAPWIDLGMLHLQRDELDLFERYMIIGCQQDDPSAHYWISTYEKNWVHQDKKGYGGEFNGTSKWLYHITKAASSGHSKAAYELGKFYAESGWKYIIDEPPDHVKPTPFDSYPAPAVKAGPTSLWDSVLDHFRIKPHKTNEPHEVLFHNAIFPATAAARLELAFEWLQYATRTGYAPAFLLIAQLLKNKTLWVQANAPLSAAGLSPDRYLYASEEDHDKDGGKKEYSLLYEGKSDPPNPQYNLQTAKDYLREVFYAHQAFQHGKRILKARKSERGAAAGEELEDEDDLPARDLVALGPHIAKWFTNPEVRESYEHEIGDLYDDAKELCDNMQWDMYDKNNALMYKYQARTGK